MKDNLVLVIIEKDLDDKEESVIGVASSAEKADEMIDQYYGINAKGKTCTKGKKDYRHDLEFSDIAWQQNIDCCWNGVEKYKCIVTVTYFELDKV